MAAILLRNCDIRSSESIKAAYFCHISIGTKIYILPVSTLQRKKMKKEIIFFTFSLLLVESKREGVIQYGIKTLPQETVRKGISKSLSTIPFICNNTY